VAREWSWYIGQNRRRPPAPVLPGIADVQPPEAAAQKENDEWWERVVKAIPTEVVGVYTIAVSTAEAGFEGTVRAVALSIILVVGLVFTYLAMRVLRGLDPRSQDPELRRAAAPWRRDGGPIRRAPQSVTGRFRPLRKRR
jgi:hypothetical protein